MSGFPRKVLSVKAVAITEGMCNLPHHQFWASVFGFDRLHYASALFLDTFSAAVLATISWLIS
jgi:hypothetical protein